MKKGTRNPDKQEILKQQQQDLNRIGELHDFGLSVPKIQEHLNNEYSQSRIQHYVTVYRLLRRAEYLVSPRCMDLLIKSGIKFANCAHDLLKLEDFDFVRVLEYCADPVNINLLGLSRDELTVYVKKLCRVKGDLESSDEYTHNFFRDNIARKYLLNNNIAACTEVVLDMSNKKLKIDVLGLDEDGCFHGIDVKANLKSFLNNMDTLNEYKKYADYMYVLTSSDEVREESLKCLDDSIGIIYYDPIIQEILPSKSRLPQKRTLHISEEKRNLLKYEMLKRESEKNYKRYLEKN